MIDSNILIVLSVIVLLTVYTFRQLRDIIKGNDFVTRQQELLYFLDDVYSIVFKEDLSVYISSNMTLSIDDPEYVSLLKKLIALLQIRIGNKQYKFYTKLYGSESNLIDFINLYFSQKISEDVAKPVIESITEGEATHATIH